MPISRCQRRVERLFGLLKKKKVVTCLSDYPDFYKNTLLLSSSERYQILTGIQRGPTFLPVLPWMVRDSTEKLHCQSWSHLLPCTTISHDWRFKGEMWLLWHYGNAFMLLQGSCEFESWWWYRNLWPGTQDSKAGWHFSIPCQSEWLWPIMGPEFMNANNSR